MASRVPSGLNVTATHPVAVAQLGQLLAGGRVPDPGRTVVGGGQPGPVRAERHRHHPIAVGSSASCWPVAGSQIRAVPSAGGGQPGPVRAERHQHHFAVGQLGQLLTGGRVPDPGRAVAGGGQPGPVRAERHRLHSPFVGQLGQLLTGGRVPDPGRTVGAGGGQPGPVRAERHRTNRAVVRQPGQLGPGLVSSRDAGAGRDVGEVEQGPGGGAQVEHGGGPFQGVAAASLMLGGPG